MIRVSSYFSLYFGKYLSHREISKTKVLDLNEMYDLSYEQTLHTISSFLENLYVSVNSMYSLCLCFTEITKLLTE